MANSEKKTQYNLEYAKKNLIGPRAEKGRKIKEIGGICRTIILAIYAYGFYTIYMEDIIVKEELKSDVIGNKLSEGDQL